MSPRAPGGPAGPEAPYIHRNITPFTSLMSHLIYKIVSVNARMSTSGALVLTGGPDCPAGPEGPDGPTSPFIPAGPRSPFAPV